MEEEAKRRRAILSARELLDDIGSHTAGERWQDCYDVAEELIADPRHVYSNCGHVLKALLDAFRDLASRRFEE